MDADNWSTLPDDLVVDIFRLLDVTAVIRCAVACRPWRRAIINNASCFRPRPDGFFADILLGFFEKHLRFGRPWQLQYVPASNAAVPFVMPATGVCADGKLHSDLLASRDGFLLLGEDKYTGNSLCLCTAHTGICRVLPAAEFDNDSVRCMYVLTTGYDVVQDYCTSDGSDKTAVWILAVRWQLDCKDGVIYQILSSTSGAWGPVKCSAKFPEDVTRVNSNKIVPIGSVVVSHGAVSWFVYTYRNRKGGRCCMVSMDLHTGRTWTMEVPPGFDSVVNSLVLAVSEDGRLSLVRMMLCCPHRMELWVLAGDGDGGQWTQRRTIDDVKKLLPNCPSIRYMRLSGFCPRSGYMFGTGWDDDRDLQHHFVIGIDGSSPRLIRSAKYSNSSTMFPYEMDSAAYISKMKYF